MCSVMAAALWGVTTGGIRGNDEERCSPEIQHFEWAQICQRWAINTLIAVIVLTLLTLLVTYFGHTFTLESNRTYFLILLVSLFAVAFIISALFCTNKRKTQSEDKKKDDRQHRASNERQSQPQVSDINSGVSGVNSIAVDL